MRRGWSSRSFSTWSADLAPPVPDRLDVVGDGGDDGLGHEGAGHGDGLLADRLEHVVDDAAGAKPVGLGPVCVLASWRPLCERCFSAV